MNFPTIAVVLIAFLSSLGRSDGRAARKEAPKEGECPYGTAVDYYGDVVCAMGPGERCGGPSHIYGRCGEGMHCKCEICTGCSVHTVVCHNGKPTCF